MADPNPLRRVIVTGAGGNLGRKLIAGLLEDERCEAVVVLDRAAPEGHGWSDRRITAVAADLLDPSDRRWRQAFAGCSAVVHLAATNPAPDSTWEEACSSFDMTVEVVEAAAQVGVGRLVFASSNHVMGQYKDPPLAKRLQPGRLGAASAPGPGTRWFTGREVVQGTAYAVSKLMGERLCVSRARASGGALTTVSICIGWCQPDENRPQTITANGIAGPDAPADYPGSSRDLRWFRNMWLSNRDYVSLMERALLADAAGWPQPGIVVNGMSANRGMAWDIEETRRLIGYDPQDNVWDHVR